MLMFLVQAMGHTLRNTYRTNKEELTRGLLTQTQKLYFPNERSEMKVSTMESVVLAGAESWSVSRESDWDSKVNIHRVRDCSVTEAEEVLGLRTSTTDGGLGDTQDPTCGEYGRGRGGTQTGHGLTVHRDSSPSLRNKVYCCLWTCDLLQVYLKRTSIYKFCSKYLL